MNATRRVVTYLSFAFFSLAIFFALPCRAAGPTYISYFVNSSEPWTKGNSPYIVQNHTVVNVPLAIEAGTVVKFVSSLADLNIKNDFYVNGTRDNPVVFTSVRDDSYGGDTNGDGTKTKPQIGNWSQISFNPSQDKELKIKYAKIFYASMGISFYPSTSQTKDMSVKNSEIRKNGIGIVIGNAKALIESSTISENANYGISANVSTKTPKAINNSITNNAVGARGVNNSNPSQIALEAKGNWWGDKTGPQNENNPGGKGNSAVGQVSFDPWTKEDPIQTPDPAIVIPGIMGSWEKNGTWQIDPIFHTYDNLCEEFLANGYEDGKNFSVFPYQWRDSNVENAKLLHKRIQDIKNETGRPKVDIVAHSMGGLLAREYIESSYYENDVDQLITVGTPHLGAPKDYVTWEAGEFIGYLSPVFKHIFKQEAIENKYDSIFHYIRGRPMASVQELLPAYDYLYDDNGSGYDLRTGYPTNYPRNEFLENLNSAEKVKALENVEFTKIIGKLQNENKTTSGFNVMPKSGEFWEHGFPKWFGILVLEELGRRTSDGDETVPLYSAEALQIPSYKKLYLQSSHNILPTDVQKDILEILTGKRPVSEVNEWKIDDILIGLVFSPVDFQVVSPSGKRLGKNFETGGEYNEIEGAYYSGFGTNTEFLTIPNPEDGEYRILTQGTGRGRYEIEIVKVTENEENEAEESVEKITGNAEPGKQEEMSVEINGMKVKKLTVAEPENKNEAHSISAEQVLTEISTKVSVPKLEAEPPRIQKLDNLKGKIRQYFKTGEIKTRKEARKIMQKLDHIRVYLKRYATKTSPKELRTAKRKANRDIGDLISRIKRDYPKKITEEAKNYVVGILEELKIE